MASISNTQRTLQYLKKKGHICSIVEKFNPHVGPTIKRKDKFGNLYYANTGIRKDLFGFIDIISISPRGICYGVQSCGQAYSEHKRKILESEIAPQWLASNNRLMLIGWRKVKEKPRVGKRMIWKPRIYEFTLEDFGLQAVTCAYCGAVIDLINPKRDRRE